MAEPATPRLSNNEFRDFIMTPRAGGSTSSRSTMNHTDGSAFKRPTTPNPNKQKKPPKSKPTIIRNPEYIDRAAERRTGKTEYDDEDTEIFLDSSGMTPGSKTQHRYYFILFIQLSN